MTEEETDFILELEEIRQRLLGVAESDVAIRCGGTVITELASMQAWMYRITRDITRKGDA